MVLMTAAVRMHFVENFTSVLQSLVI